MSAGNVIIAVFFALYLAQIPVGIIVAIVLIVRGRRRNRATERATGLRGRKARDHVRFHEIESMIADMRHKGYVAAFVEQRYQSTRNGSKAIVVLDDGTRVDTWFWWSHPDPGSIVFVRPGIGYGPHTGRSNVHYVGDRHAGSGIYGAISRADVRFHHRFLAKLQGNVAAG